MKTIWDKISPYFTSKEAWGKPEQISGLLLMVMYDLRFYSGWPIIIHCGTQGKHCEGSYHYKGMACDFHLKTPNGSIPFQDQVTHMQQYLVDMQLDDFVGLGVYPEWRRPGFHLDVRGRRARWMKRGSEYLAL